MICGSWWASVLMVVGAACAAVTVAGLGLAAWHGLRHHVDRMPDRWMEQNGHRRV